MDLSARDAYLETQVRTATPQRLRLMLIERAVILAQAAAAAWRQSSPAGAAESLSRCRDIIAELLSGIRPDDTAVVRQTLGLYAYLFSALTEVQQSRDPHQLAGIIRVLTEEQETWREVCLALPDRAPGEEPAPVEELDPRVVGEALLPHIAHAIARESLSIEA